MYHGWIPNVSGYLSFYHIGGIAIEGRTFGEDVQRSSNESHQQPSISILQSRNLSDRPKIGRLVNYNPRRGRHVFLLQAEITQSSTNQAGPRKCLRGLIYSSPAQEAASLGNLHRKFISGPRAVNKDEATQVITSWKNAGSPSTFFALAFALDEDGVITMTPMVNSQCPAQYDNAFEAYSFIKDLLHKHKFHSVLDDSVLKPIWDNKEWASTVIRDLHRSVVASYRNVSDGDAQADALGKLAYLESFLNVLRARNEPVSPNISCDALRSAITSNLDKGRQDSQQTISYRDLLLALLAITLPLLMASVQLLQIPCIDGLTYVENSICKQKFSVSSGFLEMVGQFLSNVQWAAVIIIITPVVAYAWTQRARRFKRYGAVVNHASLLPELLELLLRHAIEHMVIAIAAVLGAIVAIIYSCFAIVAWLLS